MSIWKKVLNTRLNIHAYRTSEEAVVTARHLGYPMFLWNSDVYRTPTEGEQALSQPLGICVTDGKDLTI